MDSFQKEKEQKKLLSMYENAGGEDQDAEGDVGERIECPTCGRKFIEEALMRHQKVCKKVFVQKRKVFDIKAVRQEAIKSELKDSDYRPAPSKAAPKKKAAAQAEDKPVGGAGSKAAKWKAQSEMFRAALRAAKGSDDGPSGSGSGAANAAAIMEQYDDRTECKWCNRKFNDEAATRHIPVCEQKFKATQMKMKGNAAATKAGKTTMGGFKR